MKTGEKPQVLAGLGEAGLPEAVAKADRLFFHAALYSNFARNPVMAKALETALSRPTFRGLDVVSLNLRAGMSWSAEFCDVLRQGMFPGDMARECAVSNAFLTGLADRFPHRLRRFVTTALPLAPILLVGEMILVGHYAHGPIPAPDGLWLLLPAPVERLLRRAEAAIPPGPQDCQGQAAYRFVRECVIARDLGQPVC